VDYEIVELSWERFMGGCQHYQKVFFIFFLGRQIEDLVDFANAVLS
jgi:hypothetical protein